MADEWVPVSTEERSVISKSVVMDKGNSKYFLAVKTQYPDSKPAHYWVSKDCTLWQQIQPDMPLLVETQVSQLYKDGQPTDRKALRAISITFQDGEVEAPAPVVATTPSTPNVASQPAPKSTPKYQRDDNTAAQKRRMIAAQVAVAAEGKWDVAMARQIEDWIESGSGLSRAKQMAEMAAQEMGGYVVPEDDHGDVEF